MKLSATQIQAIVDATKTPTPEQVCVVEAPRRPLLVVAGAGSGKTETMSMRVLWLLANHPDLTPASILGLTFTRKAAGELGDRLRERIRLLSREMPQMRERLDEDPVALTYNSFAERIVSEHGMRIGIDPDFAMLSEAGALDLMTQIVEAWPTDLDETLSPAGVVGKILHLAGEIAEHGYTVETAREALEEFGRELEQVGRGNDVARNVIDANRRRLAFLGPIEAYQQCKRDMGVLDFSDQLVLAARPARALDIISVAFVALLLISNIAATKAFMVGSSTHYLIFDGGAILFPLTYIIGDVLSEVYGFARARRVIVMGFVASFLASLTFFIVQYLPPAPDYENQEAFAAVLGVVWRAVVASLAGYLAGQLLNSYVLVWIRRRWGTKHLWARLIGSTIVGEAADTILFCTILFYGHMTFGNFVNYTVTGYFYKVLLEVVLLPVTYPVIAAIRRVESLKKDEVFDR